MTAPKDRAFVLSVLTREQIPHADVIAQLAAPSLRITTSAASLESLPKGASRFGGAPDVPRGFAWPTRDGRSLTFLAQIDLAEVQAPELPPSGWLLFFYDLEDKRWGFDPKDAGCAAVRFIEANRDELRRIAHPPVDAEAAPAKVHALTFVPVIDVPGVDDSLLAVAGVELWAEDDDAEVEEAVAEADELEDEDDSDPVEQRLESYANLVGELAGVEYGEPYHHLLGHPQLQQGDMRVKCELVSRGIYCGQGGEEYQAARTRALNEGVPAAWQLLLQLSSDLTLDGWSWVDAGRIFFWIRRDDLAARAFERAWLILQT
jgi:uncharacterized protein YwqG